MVVLSFSLELFAWLDSFDSGNLLLYYRALINYMKCLKSGWLVAACEWKQAQGEESRLVPFLPHNLFYLAFVFRSSGVETISCIICNSYVPMDLSMSGLGFLTELWL